MRWPLETIGRSKHIRYDDSQTTGKEEAELDLLWYLNLNHTLKMVAIASVPIIAAAIVWFGWDAYSNHIHNLGDRIDHLAMLFKSLLGLLHNQTERWQHYHQIITQHGMTIHIIIFTITALLASSTISYLLYQRLHIRELTAELFVRGSKASHSVKQSVHYLKRQLKGKGDRFLIAPRVTIPEDIFSKHMLAFGTTGVGKTQILWNILNGILSKDSPFKLCLFDFKADFIKAFMHHPDFGLIAVYDERSLWWDFMQDINSTLDIEALAYQLIPDGSDKDPFWRNTARNLVIDAIDYMKQSNLKGWATLYKLLGDRDLILKALATSGGRSATSISKDNNTSNSVMTTLNEAIRPIAILAKAWGDDGNGHPPISIAKWVNNDPSVPKHLIFGWSEHYAATLAPVFAAFMDGVLGTKLKPDSDKSVKIFMAWDEFASIPAKVSKLATALRTGRSIGISFFLGCLNINDIYHRYGQEEGKTIMSLLRTQFGLLVGGADGAQSAQYISDSWGKQTVKIASWRQHPVKYLNTEGKEQTRNEWLIEWSEVTRSAVGADVFIEGLQSTRQAGCVEGYAKFENLMPCKLRWHFYTPNESSPEIIPAAALQNQYDSDSPIDNILETVTTKPEFDDFTDDYDDLTDDYEAFPDDLEYPDLDEMPPQ